MIFSDNEIDQLSYFKIFAKTLNNYDVLLLPTSKGKLKIGNEYVDKNDFYTILKSSFQTLNDYFVKNFSLNQKKIISRYIALMNNDLKRGLEPDDINNIELRNFVKVLTVSIFDFFERMSNDHLLDFKYEEVHTLNSFFKTFFDIIINAAAYYRGYDESAKYNLNKKIVILEDKVNNLLKDKNHNDGMFEAHLNKLVSDQGIIFNERVDKVIKGFESNISRFQEEYEKKLKGNVEDLTGKLSTSQSELNTLLGDVNLYKSMVSDKTENEISKYYSAKAKKEKNTYWGSTGLSITIIIVSLITAWCGLSDYYHTFVSIDLSPEQCKKFPDIKSCAENIKLSREATEKFGLIYLIMRLIFSVLLFLTVIYTSRIAIRAYSHWRHSESMHLKLASLRPFINQLQEEERNQIHKDLVPDYFGKDAGIVETNNEKLKDFPTNMSTVAIKLIEQLPLGGSNSSTEKNNKKPESETG